MPPDTHDADLPPPGADVLAVWEFARTFDGYSYAARRAYPAPPMSDYAVWRLGCLLANPARAAFLTDGVLPETVPDLRACLFFEWRRLHGLPVRPEMLRYLHALIEKIRRAVSDPPPQVGAGNGVQ